MAVSALAGRWLIEKNGLTLDVPMQLVAIPAGNFLVSTLEGEVRPRLVVEQGGSPACRIVAACAGGILAVLGKLPGMGIFMATIAGLGGGAVDHVLHGYFQVGGLVAVHARHRPMCARQGKLRGVMVEAQFLAPGRGRMARLAAHRRPIRAQLHHARRELIVVRVDVAGRASETREVEGYRGIGVHQVGFMAINAGHGQMGPRERESGGAVLFQRVGGGLEALHCVAVLAAIPKGRARELSFMNIRVAIGTSRELDFVLRVQSPR